MGIYFAEKRAECVPSSSVTRKKELCITNKQIPLKKKLRKKYRSGHLGSNTIFTKSDGLHPERTWSAAHKLWRYKGLLFSHIRLYIHFSLKNIKGRPYSLVLFLRTKPCNASIYTIQEVQLLNSTKPQLLTSTSNRSFSTLIHWSFP